MSSKISNLLETLVHNPSQEKTLRALQDEVRLANIQKSKEIIKILKSFIKSRTSSPAEKLQSLQILVLCMDSNNPLLFRCVAKKLLQRLQKLAMFNKESKDPERGRSMFAARTRREQDISASFLKLLLASFEKWAKRNAKIEDSPYVKAYSKLLSSGVVFPTTDVIKNLHKVKKQARTISSLIEQNSSTLAAVKPQIQTLKTNKAELEGKISENPELNLDESTVKKIIKAIETLSDTYKKYKQWKYSMYQLSDDFTPYFVDKLYHSSTALEMPRDIEEPIPKTLPQLNLLSQSMVVDDLSDSEASRTIRQSPEVQRLQEQLAETEELVQTYKQDFFTLQQNYLAVQEEREEFALSLKIALKEKETLMNEVSQVHDISKQNSELHENLDMHKVRAESLEQLIKEREEENRSLVRSVKESSIEMEKLSRMNVKLSLKIEELELQLREVNDYQTLNFYQSFSRIIGKREDTQIKPAYSVENSMRFSSKEDSSSDSCNFQRDMSIGEIIVNQSRLMSCIAENGGLLYTDLCIDIECSMRVQDRKCRVSLEFLNKSHNTLKFNGEVTSSPENLRCLSSQCAFQMQGKSRAELILEFKRRNVFEGHPVLSLGYKNKDISCDVSLGLPITQLVYLSPEKYDFEDIWDRLSSFKSRNTLVGPFERIHRINLPVFNSVVSDESLVFYTVFGEWPLLCKFEELDTEITVELRCEDNELGDVIMKLLTQILE